MHPQNHSNVLESMRMRLQCVRCGRCATTNQKYAKITYSPHVQQTYKASNASTTKSKRPSAKNLPTYWNRLGINCNMSDTLVRIPNNQTKHIQSWCLPICRTVVCEQPKQKQRTDNKTHTTSWSLLGNNDNHTEKHMNSFQGAFFCSSSTTARCVIWVVGWDASQASQDDLQWSQESLCFSRPDISIVVSSASRALPRDRNQLVSLPKIPSYYTRTCTLSHFKRNCLY
jgi:hypothetical protein